MLRYHNFVPKPYLAYGAKLLRNAVDRRDVAEATADALCAAMDRRIGLFRTIVHSNHGMPTEIVENFQCLGPEWCESIVPGSIALIEKYEISLPEKVEQDDLSDARDKAGWSPKVGFVEFLKDLQARDALGEDVRALWTPSDLAVVQ